MTYQFNPAAPAEWPDLGIRPARRSGRSGFAVGKGAKAPFFSTKAEAEASCGFDAVAQKAVLAARKAKHYAFRAWPKWQSWSDSNAPWDCYEAFAAARQEACVKAACEAAKAVFAAARS